MAETQQTKRKKQKRRIGGLLRAMRRGTKQPPKEEETHELPKPVKAPEASPPPIEKRRQKPRIPPVHEFLQRFREQAAECISNAYIADHEQNESVISGTLTTTLCEDVFSLVNLQVDVLHEYLIAMKLIRTRAGDAVLAEGLLSMIRTLYFKQTHFRSQFLVDLESSCAAANDFYRMMESFDELMDMLQRRYKHISWCDDNELVAVLVGEAADLIALYGHDSIRAVRHAQTFVIQEIQQSSIPVDLFGRDWEERYTHNQIALRILRILEEYLYDLHNYLCNDFLYGKIVGGIIEGVVCCYIRTLLQKADVVRRGRRAGRRGQRDTGFISPAKAYIRMMYDIQLFRTYFQQLSKQMPVLAKVVDEELSLLVVFQEILGMSAGETNLSSLEELILVLLKKVRGDLEITKYMVQDLWLLGAPKRKQKEIESTFLKMQAELQALSSRIAEDPTYANDIGTELYETLNDLYEDRMLQERVFLCGSYSMPGTEPTTIMGTKALARHFHEESKSAEGETLVPPSSLPRGSRRARKGNPQSLERLLVNLKLHNIKFMKHIP